MPNEVPDFDQYVEYVTEGNAIHPVLLLQQSFDALPTLAALAKGYQHVAALGRSVELVPAEVDAVKTVVIGAYHQDVADHEVSSDPAATVDRLIWVRDHPQWSVGITVVAGVVYFHEGNLWRCVQGHTTQLDYQPGATGTAALWTRYYANDEIVAWVQPLGSFDAYPLGRRVTHAEKTWESLIPANVTVPGSDARWWKDLSAPTTQEWISGTYALDVLVTHNGRTWKSLIAGNAYEPGVIGTWRDQSVPPLWVAPAGSVGVWQPADPDCLYNGHTWHSLVANNSWTPGAAGLWQQVT